MALGQVGYTGGAGCFGSQVNPEICGSLGAHGEQGGTFVSKGQDCLKLKVPAGTGWCLWALEGWQWWEENWALCTFVYRRTQKVRRDMGWRGSQVW